MGGFAELLIDCNVHALDQVQRMPRFPDWMAYFHFGLRAFQGGVAESDFPTHAETDAAMSRSVDAIVNGDIAELANPTAQGATELYGRMTNSDLRFVLDLKCQTASDVLVDLVHILNYDFGVVVTGVGSFYELPSGLERIVQSSQIESTDVRVHRYLFFFGVEDLEDGIKDGRLANGENVLITGAALLEPEHGATCVMTINANEVDRLKRLKDQHKLNVGLWTQEADLNAGAFDALVTLSELHRSTFDLGFALGGNIYAGSGMTKWPIANNADNCDWRGGRASLNIMPNKSQRFADTANRFWK